MLSNSSRRPSRESQRSGGDPGPGDLREELRPVAAPQVHLPGRPRRQQAGDRARDRGALRGAGREGRVGQHPARARQGQAPRHARRTGPDQELEESRRDPGRRAEPARPLREFVMPVRKYKPTSTGRRFMSTSSFEEITTDTPEKSLLEALPKAAGRNNQGKITVRHQGGGYKKVYRKIDFKRDKHGIPGKVATIEYDPNRSARIALINYRDGEKRYILAPLGLKVGDPIESGPEAPVRIGNAIPLSGIPVGSTIHNIEVALGRGGQLVRSAGASAQLLAKEGDYAVVRMPSSELRRIHVNCQAPIGQVGNIEHENESGGKAGRGRWLGQRPEVRGSTMNPRDHPHGGGEGKTGPGGNPKTPWGKPALGYRTRKANKASAKLIIRRREKKGRKK